MSGEALGDRGLADLRPLRGEEAQSDLASGRLTAVHPNVWMTGRLARDERGTFWYVQAPEPPWEYHGEPPFCTSPLERCRLVRASASPFSSTTRALTPRLRVMSPDALTDSGPSTDPIVMSGDLTRAIVRRSTVVRREPLPAVPLELLRSDRPYGEGPFAATGLTTSTDQAGRWSFSLSQPPLGGVFRGGRPAGSESQAQRSLLGIAAL